jgi:LPS-assembly protein
LAPGLSAQAAPLQKLAAKPAKTARPAEDDGLRGGGFYLEADSLIRDESRHLIIAEGEVEARYKGKTIRADRMDYQSDTGMVTATGHVVIVNADGTTEYAKTFSLDKDASEGMAVGFAARLEDQVKIAAASTTRQNARYTELDNVIFTPCQVCADNGDKHPTWSIRARKIVEDHEKKVLYFKHAVLEVKGVGVLYLPAFSTADPTSSRKSGFLLPTAAISGARGLSYEQPYYFALSSSQDLTIAPQINTNVNPFLNIEYRKRFYSGLTDIRAGYTYDSDFTSTGHKFGAETSRSYILGSGLFRLSPQWQWGFTAERASDKLIFDKYSVQDVYSDRGLYAADNKRLISQIFGIRQDANSYFSIAAISVQGLRPNDQQSTIPTIAPLIEGRWEPDFTILGGRFRVLGSAVALSRDQSPNLTGSPGLDSRRATLQFDWRRNFTLDSGVRVSPFVLGRADLYNMSNEPAPYRSDATVARTLGTIGADISYPLFKQSRGVTYVLEPLAQVAISPNTKLNPLIPNEDSAVWEFDETNLFEVNRSPGYDLYQGGQHVTLGGRATATLPDGRSGSVLLGQMFSAREDPFVPQRTGLQGTRSDYILAASADITKGVSFYSRWRLDPENLAINRLEVGANFANSHASGYVSYLQEAQSPNGYKVESLDLHGEAFFTKHWGVTGYVIVDSGAWRRRDVGLLYRDDCLRVEVLYRHDETYNATLGPTTSVILRLSLATFGNSGYSR